jgi:peroxiredoxin
MQMHVARSFAFLGVLALVATCGAQEAGKTTPPAKSDAPVGAKVGAAAPDFTLTDSNGKEHKLSDLKDKVVVLEWVNKECPWCLKAIPAVKALRKTYEPKGVVWLAVDSTHGRKAEDNVAFAKEKDLGYTILMDPDGKVGRLYGAKTTPHVFVINKGTLVYNGALHNNQQGDKPDSEVRNYVDEALGAVLAGKDVPVAETKSWGCSVKYAKDNQAGK